MARAKKTDDTPADRERRMQEEAIAALPETPEVEPVDYEPEPEG